MEFRSTNDAYSHYQGDLISNVSEGGPQNSSHGVQLTGGTTGAIVTAAGDKTNIPINFAGKGTAAVRVGNSSSPLILVSQSATFSTGTVLQVGSTAPFAGFVRFTDTAVATPNFNTTNMMVMETTHVITGVNSSHFIVANGVNLSTDCVIAGAFAGSTAGDVHCRLLKASNAAVGASTATINFLVYRF